MWPLNASGVYHTRTVFLGCVWSLHDMGGGISVWGGGSPFQLVPASTSPCLLMGVVLSLAKGFGVLVFGASYVYYIQTCITQTSVPEVGNLHFVGLTGQC